MPLTKNCKICFKQIKENDLSTIFNKDICLCNTCFQELDPKFIQFNVDGYNATAIYEYNEFVKKLIYQYKGCFDYELYQVYLNLYYKEINIRYKDYVIIPIPSYKEDDEERGFNHVIEVFKTIGLKMVPALEKTSHFKQANNTAKKRKEIHKYLRTKSDVDIINKKVLIVDDIYTTGATMSAAIKLIEKLKPRKIEVFVLAKTKDKSTKN